MAVPRRARRGRARADLLSARKPATLRPSPESVFPASAPRDSRRTTENSDSAARRKGRVGLPFLTDVTGSRMILDLYRSGKSHTWRVRCVEVLFRDGIPRSRGGWNDHRNSDNGERDKTREVRIPPVL